MTVQSFRTCLYASGCFDPCCDAPCPKHADPVRTPAEWSRAVMSVLRSYARHANPSRKKRTLKNIPMKTFHSRLRTATEGLFSDINPGNLGRPLCFIMIGDMGYYYRKLPAFDGDYDKLIETLNLYREDFEESPKRPTTGENPLP